MRKLVAILVSILNCVSVYIITNDVEAFYVVMSYHIILVLPLILFSDILGATGIIFWTGERYGGKESPPWIIELFGWFFLIFPYIVMMFYIWLN
ncbi:MAG: hypothetical protein ABGX27_04150 [Desulfurobacteriaceae bacterium]